MSKYGAFSGSYFPVFKLNTGKYRPEKTPPLDTIHVVTWRRSISKILDKKWYCTINKKESKNLIKFHSDLSVFFPYLVKALKDYSVFNHFRQTNFLQSLTLVLFRKTPALLNYYQLLIKFKRVLIIAQQQILERFSSIFQKRLMSFGIMVYFSNFSP